MTDFRKLAAGLSAYNGGGYDGYVIARAKWRLEREVHTVESRIKTEREGYLVIEVTGYDDTQNTAGRLQVTMLKAKAPFKTENVKKQGAVKGAFSFTQEQVEEYLDSVQDTNPIHRGENAIVPGLMLLDFILNLEQPVPGKEERTIRFREPLFVGKPCIYLVKDGKICIISPEHEFCYAQVDK